MLAAHFRDFLDLLLDFPLDFDLDLDFFDLPLEELEELEDEDEAESYESDSLELERRRLDFFLAGFGSRSVESSRSSRLSPLEDLEGEPRDS